MASKVKLKIHLISFIISINLIAIVCVVYYKSYRISVNA